MIGRGTIKIIEDCNRKGYPKLMWESSHGVTTFIFNGITVHSKIDDAVKLRVISFVIISLLNTCSFSCKQIMGHIYSAVVFCPGFGDCHAVSKGYILRGDIGVSYNGTDPICI